MAVDMSNVKQIMHNNKEVIKIEDSLGHIIWQKVPEQPFRRLEYIAFDGTNYCDSVEHNANNRAYRLDFIQEGWNDSGLCYPFGIWSNTTPKNILLVRNERSNTETGFEVCRIAETAFGTHPSGSYLNKRMVAEMRWGTDTNVSYRLRYRTSSSYINNARGAAKWRNGTNTGNFFIGAINDGGGGTHTNANGMLVGKIYEVAIAGSNSFNDYNYFYVPCQRKSDGAIGFKQPHLTGEDSFHPLRNKSDGSIVTDVSSHMGPVVDNNWDGVTYDQYAPYWHTIWKGDYSITCEAINGQVVSQPESNRVVYHIDQNVTAYSDMKIKVYYQFEWIGNRNDSTPGNTSLTEYTVSNLSSDKTILYLPVTPTDSTLSLTDFIASGVRWNASTSDISFETRGSLKPEDTEYLRTTIRITKIEVYY